MLTKKKSDRQIFFILLFPNKDYEDTGTGTVSSVPDLC